MEDLSSNTRTYGGNSKSYNGWPFITHNGTVAATVPGTKDVNIPVRKGDVATILNAWAAVWNREVMPIATASRDYGGWTSTNSHPTSCHLSGTAIDLNWNTLPFRARSMSGPDRAIVNRMVNDFRGVISWGGHWSDPVDEMHAEITVLPGDPRIAKLVADLEAGYLGVYGPAQPTTPGGSMAITNYDKDRPGVPANRVPLDLTGAVARVLFEATFWVKRRSLTAVRSPFKTQPDTVLGHAVDAATLAAANHEILRRLAAKMDVDISDLG